jgi:hypothetical protein
VRRAKAAVKRLPQAVRANTTKKRLKTHPGEAKINFRELR